MVTPAMRRRRPSSSSPTSLAKTGDVAPCAISMSLERNAASTSSRRMLAAGAGRDVAVDVAAHLGDEAALLEARDDALDVVGRQAELGDQLLLGIAGAARLVRRRRPPPAAAPRAGR